MSRLSHTITLSLVAVVGSSWATPIREPQSAERTRRITFDVSEGTWMTLDVSPDGRKILFDILGDLYEMPIAGGKATKLTSGWAFNRAARYSPDGTQISVVRDG